MSGEKLRQVDRGSGVRGYEHWCPGCKTVHFIQTAGLRNPVAQFNGDLARPTFLPAQTISTPAQPAREADGEKPATEAVEEALCRYLLEGGALNFKPDCTHALAGKSVPLPTIPDGI